MCVSFLLLILLAILGPMIGFPRPRLVADRTEALNHIRSVGFALSEFHSEYGSFPSSSTATEVKSNTGTTLTLGDGSSNQLFRQLMVTGTKSEKSFWAKTAASRSSPWNT